MYKMVGSLGLNGITVLDIPVFVESLKDFFSK